MTHEYHLAGLVCYKNKGNQIHTVTFIFDMLNRVTGHNPDFGEDLYLY